VARGDASPDLQDQPALPIIQFNCNTMDKRLDELKD
jgi:hypothetical protein